jgi:hypothetical protein
MKHLLTYLTKQIATHRDEAAQLRTTLSHDTDLDGEERASMEESVRVCEAMAQAFGYALEVTQMRQSDILNHLRGLAATYRASGSRYLDGCADGLEMAARLVGVGSFADNTATDQTATVDTGTAHKEKDAAPCGSTHDKAAQQKELADKSIAQVAAAGNCGADACGADSVPTTGEGGPHHG